LRAHDLALLLQVGQFLLDGAEAVLGSTVLLFLEGLPLDLELSNLALDLIEFLWQAVDLHAQA
jgi:hypothetical protein